MKSGFRQDINGLRAWAVIAVILFHFGIPGFSGGFVGVDIFFVISGFLMTGIIYKGLTEDSFSILDFYLSRAKRTIPALLVLCAVLLILGWNFLPAIEYEQLGKHVFGAATFLSNIVFWQEAGYFDSASHDKWLLHTWSLSVEWQFYILLPLALIAIWKISPKKNTLIAVYFLGILASLALSTFAVNWKPSAAFYLLPTRAWEMLAGGLVFLLQQNITKNTRYLKLYEIIGFSCIVLSIAIFDKQTLWPGWKALLPTIGSCLVIIGNQSNSILSTTKPHSVLGKSSYSLYLWHWPIVVSLAYIEKENNTLWTYLGLLMSILLGVLSYKFFELRPSKYLNKIQKKSSLKIILTIVLAASISGTFILQQRGIYGRIPGSIDAVFDQSNNRNPRLTECNGTKFFFPKECTYGGKDLGVIVLGDSHAATVVRTIERSLNNPNLHVLDWTTSSCPVIYNVKTPLMPLCQDFNHYTYEKQKKLPPHVPLVFVSRITATLHGINESSPPMPPALIYITERLDTRTEEYRNEISKAYTDTLCLYQKHRQVYVMRPTPELKKHVPKTMGRSLIAGKTKEVKIPRSEYDERIKIVDQAQEKAQAMCGVIILDPSPYLCDEKFCYGSKDKLPIYYDDDHLNENGSMLLTPLFESIFQ